MENRKVVNYIENYQPRVSKKVRKIDIAKKSALIQEQFIYYILSRIVFMIIALAFSFVVLPYYTYDDLNWYSVVTLDQIDPMFYLRQRQVWIIICAAINSVEIFKLIQLPRIINIIFGWFVIKELQHTMDLIGLNEQVIKRFIRFMIIFPVYMIFTCSLTKEIIFMWCVWAIINQMFELIDYHHMSISKTIICSILGMMFRFGVIESLLMVMVAIYIWRSKGIRRLLGIMGVLVIAVIAIQMWSVVGVNVIFEQKTRIYLGSENKALGTKSLLGLVLDVVKKLFGAGPRLHPQEGKLLWISFLGYLSIFNIYIMYWSVIWLIKREKRWNEWFMFGFLVVWMLFLSYMDAIIYRQILFLQPVLWILGCKAMYSIHDKNTFARKIGGVVIPTLIYGVMFIYVRM